MFSPACSQACAEKGAEASMAPAGPPETAQAAEEEAGASATATAAGTGQAGGSTAAPSRIGALESQHSAKEQLSVDAACR